MVLAMDCLYVFVVNGSSYGSTAGGMCVVQAYTFPWSFIYRYLFKRPGEAQAYIIAIFYVQISLQKSCGDGGVATSTGLTIHK